MLRSNMEWPIAFCGYGALLFVAIQFLRSNYHNIFLNGFSDTSCTTNPFIGPEPFKGVCRGFLRESVHTVKSLADFIFKSVRFLIL